MNPDENYPTQWLARLRALADKLTPDQRATLRNEVESRRMRRFEVMELAERLAG
jgi:hypothetical protein